MKLSSKLQSPAALVFEGFLAGAVIFFTLQPLARADAPPPPPPTESVLSDLEA